MTSNFSYICAEKNTPNRNYHIAPNDGLDVTYCWSLYAGCPACWGQNHPRCTGKILRSMNEHQSQLALATYMLRKKFPSENFNFGHSCGHLPSFTKKSGQLYCTQKDL